MLPWQQLLSDALRNLTSSRSSLGKHTMKICCKLKLQSFKNINHIDFNFLLMRKCPRMCKVLDDHRRNAGGSHLVFQNEAKHISRQAFALMNISCKFDNSTYNTLGSRGVMGKSLHTTAVMVYWCINHSNHLCYSLDSMML